MFAPLLAAVRADVDRQVGWAKGEVRRQARYTALIGILAGTGVLASVGAVVVGLIALHTWLAIKTGPLVAHGIISLGLLLLALVLFAFVFAGRPPRLAARPPLQFVRHAAAFGALGSGRGDPRVVANGAQTLNVAMDALRHGSRSTLLGTLVLAVVVGLIASRKLQPTTRGAP